MKKYVLKSVIIFTMILILGLILIPMIPTEKEYVYSNGYELLAENELMDYSEWDGYFYDIAIEGYNVILVYFTALDLGISIPINLVVNEKTYLYLYGFDILVDYTVSTDFQKIWFASENMGDINVSIWGVSK